MSFDEEDDDTHVVSPLSVTKVIEIFFTEAGVSLGQPGKRSNVLKRKLELDFKDESGGLGLVGEKP